MQKIKFLCISLCTISTITADQSDNLHNYMWANYTPEQADKRYQQIFKSGGSIYANKGYIHYLDKKNRYKEITQLIPKLDAAFSNDSDIQLIFALALKKTNAENAADDRLIRLNRKFKNNPEITFHVAEAYVKRKEPENALDAINDFLNNAPKRANNFVFYYLKAQIYTQLNNHAQALKNIKEALNIHPRFAQGWLLFAMMEERTGNLIDAIKGYTQYLEVNPGTNKQIEHHLLQLVLKQKGAEQHKQILVVNKSCFEKTLIFFQRKQYQQALAQIDQCLTEKPSDTQSKLLKIQILTSMKKIHEAIQTIAAWIGNEPNNEMWYKIMHVLARSGAPATPIIAALQSIHTKHPQNLLPTLYLADLYTRTKNSPQAITHLTKARNQATDTHLKTKISFQLGLLYYEQQDYANMKTVLEQGKALGTNFPPLLNLLAYYYATKGKQLVQAEQLLQQVITQDKNNPHFRDTQTVIFYKQQKFDLAKKLLEKLATHVPNDAMITIHLAKTHYKQGNKTQAKETIQKAQAIAKPGYEQRTVTKLLKRWQ